MKNSDSDHRIFEYLQKHDVQITELEMEVNDMNGKFVIPKLKKVKHLHVAETED